MYFYLALERGKFFPYYFPLVKGAIVLLRERNSPKKGQEMLV